MQNYNILTSRCPKAAEDRKVRLVSDCSQMIARSKWSRVAVSEDVAGNISEDHSSQWLADWC